MQLSIVFQFEYHMLVMPNFTFYSLLSISTRLHVRYQYVYSTHILLQIYQQLEFLLRLAVIISNKIFVSFREIYLQLIWKFYYLTEK